MKLAIAATLFSVILQMGGSPTLTYNQNTENFSVSFDKGASFACVAFKAHNQTIIQGGKKVPYEPRKCYGIGESMTGFQETWEDINCTVTDISKGQVDCPNGDLWDVRAEVQYETKGNQFETRSSNILTLKH